MIISFQGGESVRFQTGDMVIATNPSVAPHGYKVSKFGANLVLCSSFEPVHHAVDNVSHGDADPFVIDGPGSYEYRGYTVMAEQLGKNFSEADQATTAYSFVMDDIRVCILGSVVGRDDLQPDMSDILSETDILVIPVDGEKISYVNNLINFIDPKMIIPVGYWSEKDAGIALFMKEHGLKSSEMEDKVTIKRRDVDAMSKTIKALAA